MSSDATRVAIVVAEDGGVDLGALVRKENVWVVDTARNRAAAEAIWAGRQGSERYHLTTFNVDISETRDEWLASILPVVDEHHSLRADWATDVALHVYGAAPTPRVRAALADLGPFEIVEWPGGFSANRGRAV